MWTSFQVRVKLPGSEFCKVSTRYQVTSEIQAKVTFRDVTFVRFLVTEILRELEQPLKIFGDQESQDRMLVEVYPFAHKLVQVLPMPQRDPTTVTRHQVPIVVKVVVPLSQEGWLARLAEKVACRMGAIESLQLAGSPSHQEQLYLVRPSLALRQRHIVFQRELALEAELPEPVVVGQLVDHDISAEHLLADPDASLGSLKGNVFGIEGIHRDQDALETGLLEAPQSFPRHLVVSAPGAVCLDEGRGDVEPCGYLDRFR